MSTTTSSKSEKWTLGTAFLNFWKFFSPCALAVGALVFVTARIAVGDFQLLDLAIVAVMLLAWPLVEWTIHVFILHRKPTRVGGRTLDLHLAKKHRAHHREPTDLHDVVIPPRSLVLLMITLPPAVLLLSPDLPRALTFLAFLFVMGLIYEWCHFLIHTNYRPKTRLYRHLWQHHRLHHFKHEEYYFGVSMTAGDRLLGTAPDFNEIPTSQTCRTLGVDDEVPT